MTPAARVRRAPVTLRDFLELGCESSSDGFRSYPRCLPSDEAAACVLKPPARELSRSPSWSPSAAFFLTNKSPGALARISSLSRSLSRRISFWRRREYDVGELDDDRDSCEFPSPLVSSCSASESETTDIVIEEETSSAPVFESASTSASASSSGAEADDRDCGDVPGAAGDGGHDVQALVGDGDPAVGRRRSLETTMEVDKQQLSPVSVLDFPADDDDGDEGGGSDAGTCSPPFLQHHSHHSHSCAAGKKKERVLHRIRRFDGPTTDAVVDHLEARFTTSSSDESGEESVVVVDDDAHGRCARLSRNSRRSSDDSEAAKTTTTTVAAPRHEYYEEHRSVDERSQGQLDEEPDDERRLLARLLDDAAAAVDEITEWLLLDFFAEGIGRLRSSSSVAGRVVVDETTAKPRHDVVVTKATALADAAMDWLRGAGPRWGVGDVMSYGESALRDMERGRRWMCVREEEERYVAAEVEALVMDGLVDELVTELAPLVLYCADDS